MNGFYGLGQKPIKVTLAIPKRSLAEATNKINTTYSDMYESYWSDPGALANYGSFQVNRLKNPDSLLRLSGIRIQMF